ncbi:hypothetical protein SCLCIDRAFT_675988 [Scleroderma citrinum Foug A]|uniref:Uncharacterized protein n=1 Tax=Scleroderma citrinum Foug A TaxID=1036808 RepID=A0A0C3E7H3_9AGAM|nr:hypothetical protein SCLCIDRAFT_675988 [Scleroderma citrinum Foug A]
MRPRVGECSNKTRRNYHKGLKSIMHTVYLQLLDICQRDHLFSLQFTTCEPWPMVSTSALAKIAGADCLPGPRTCTTQKMEHYRTAGEGRLGGMDLGSSYRICLLCYYPNTLLASFP